VAAETIRLLSLLSTARRGGTELSVLALSERLADNGFTIDAAFLEPPGPVSERFASLGFDTHHADPTPGLIYRLARILEKTRAQVLVAYGFRANLAARLAGKLTGTLVLGGLRSIMLTDAEEEGSTKEGLALTLDKVTFPMSGGYVSNSQAAATRLEGLGYPGDKLFVVQGGIDPDRGSHAPARLDLALPGAPVVVTVGNLKPVKGQNMLIRAAGLLMAEGLRFNLVFVGDGPLRRDLERQVKKVGLDNCTVLLGIRDDVDAILAASDVFVLPSIWEGLPVAVMEAMAHSLPVVATRSGGTPELFTGSKQQGRGLKRCREGFLVPPRNPKPLAAGLAALLGDEGLRKEMGRAGRRRIEETFNLERMATETAELYRRLHGEWLAKR
jgi:glycosyltransferase involved in cell wall biosynthesis